MISFLLASMLTCAEASYFISNLANANIPDIIKTELKDEIKSSSPLSCNLNQS